MAINIKEILSADSNSQKDEKINYNFDQVVANGGGPIGVTGAQGASGASGAKGATGAQGPIGPQGSTGTATDYFVRSGTSGAGAARFTLLPDDASSGIITTMVLGDITSAAVKYNDSTLYIKADTSVSDKQLRLGTDDVNDYIDLSFTSDGVTASLSLTPPAVNTPTTQLYNFNGQTLKLNNGSDRVTLNEANSVFESNLEVNGVLKITSGTPGLNKVLTSDANGTASWTSRYETPIGTIVMAPKFVLDNSVNWTGSNNPSGNSDYIGRGIGEWSGWYYCNGQTWTGSGVTYQVPTMIDRLPLGYSDTSFNSASASSQTANLTRGIKTVDQLTSITPTATTAPHTHELPTFNGQAEDGSTGGTSIGVITGTYLTSGVNTGTTSTPITVAPINVSPKTTTVGYMIYLGYSTLVYAINQGPTV